MPNAAKRKRSCSSRRRRKVIRRTASLKIGNDSMTRRRTIFLKPVGVEVTRLKLALVPTQVRVSLSRLLQMILALAFLSAISARAAVSVKAQLDRDTIMVGETAMLSIS